MVAGVAADVKELKAYLADGMPSPSTFQQVELGRRGAPPRAYERVIQSFGRVEGSLVGRVDFPLDRYLDPHSQGGARPKIAWPSACDQKIDAFFLEFKPALMEWPVEAREREPVEAMAQVTAYERNGVPFAYGTCRRTMRLAGLESVSVDEQSFEDAVRMEADTELAFGWLATIRVHETAWFARGVGLVRREERFNGRAFRMFRFQGVSRYELADKVAARVETVADEVGEGENGLKGVSGKALSETIRANSGWWSRLAIGLERNGRHIRVSGVAIEWDRTQSERPTPNH